MTHHFEDELSDSALGVVRGVEEAPAVNPNYKRAVRRELSVDDFVEGILARNVTILAQAITLVESNNPDHYARAQEIIERCLPHAGRSIRVGITGVPGAGKSTFIEAIGGMVARGGGEVTGGVAAQGGHRLAVLAIDPSSERSGGSILGDKTRMESIAGNPDIFIRPSPSAGSLGGVARKTRETIVLCEAAGYDVIFIETVGVGQSETAVHSMADIFMMLQIAGAGDELQGIKRGIMEMADLAVITKADGDNITKAELTANYFKNALMLFPMPESGWRPQVFTASALTRAGLTAVWGNINEYITFIKANGYFEAHRHRQNKYWMLETITAALQTHFFDTMGARFSEQEAQVEQNLVTPFIAARQLLNNYYHEKDTLNFSGGGAERVQQ